jgi:hypothetical protein
MVPWMRLRLAEVGVVVKTEIEILSGTLVVVAIPSAVDGWLRIGFSPIPEMNDFLKNEEGAISEHQPGRFALRGQFFKGIPREDTLHLHRDLIS